MPKLPHPEEIQLVAFDMDGVVLDSMPALCALAIRVVKELEPSLTEEAIGDHYIETAGLPFCEQIKDLLPNNMQRVMAVIRYEEQHAKLARNFRVNNRMKDLLWNLRKNDILAVLVSSTSRRIIQESIPQVQGMGFDAIYGFDTGWDKTQQIQSALDVFGVHMWRTILVGDTRKDLECATKLGTLFFLVNFENVVPVVMGGLSL